MPPRPNPIPAYRHHRPSGRAYVRLPVPGSRRGKDVYLGEYGSPESKREYARIVRQIEAGAKPAAARRDGPTVAEVLAAFLRHADVYYRRPDGTPTGEPSEFRRAAVPLAGLYGPEPAAEFGPQSLTAVRTEMVKMGWCRTRTNRQVQRVKLVFRWAAAEGLVPPAVADGLRVVAGLRKGRSAARESEPVGPVEPERVAKVLPHCTPTLRTMLELQALSGMRPGEVRGLTAGEVDRTGVPWVYRPASHKMAHAGRDRVVFFGPKARAALGPWLDRAKSPDDRLFTPANSKAEWYEMLRAKRKSKVTPSQVNRKKPAGERVKHWRAYWTIEGYAQAVRKACLRAGVDPFHPHQLRHSAATLIRDEFGVEAAQAVLGHARISVTELYAQKSEALAAGVAERIG